MRTVSWVSVLGLLPFSGVDARASRSWQQPVKPPYEATVAGMACKQSRSDYAPNGQLECTYRVGADLLFQIVGVGEPDVNIGVRKAADYESADYVFDFSMGHRCVIVSAGNRTKRALGALVVPGFVSPRTGKVFRSWQECSRG